MGPVQVGGGAPVVVQSMSNTDTVDIKSTATQCIELAQRGLRHGADHRQHPGGGRGRAGDQEADARRRGAGAAHRRLPLQRPRPADEVPRLREGARQVPHQPRQRRQGRAARRAVRDDLPHRARQRQARAHRRQRRLPEPGARHGEDAGEHGPRPRASTLRGDHQRVHGPLGPAVDRARHPVGPAQGPDHHLVQGLAAARPDRRLPRARDAHGPAAPPRPDRGGDGHEGARVVRVRDGRVAQRGHRRHDPHLAHPAPERRPPRRGLRRVRAAPVARHPVLRAERDGVPGLRPHDLVDVPGARRAHPGLHPRPDAGLEGAVRRRREHDARRHGLHRQRPRRVEGRLDRHLAARARAKSRTAPSTSTGSTSRR